MADTKTTVVSTKHEKICIFLRGRAYSQVQTPTDITTPSDCLKLLANKYDL